MASPYIKAAAGVLGALALVVLPVASAYAATATTTVSGTIDPTLSITSSGVVDMGTISPTGATRVEAAGGSDTVTVTTNNSAGYKLDLEMNSGSNNNNLVNGTSDLLAAGDVATANTWGYRLGTSGAYAAVPVNGSPVQLATQSTPSVAAGDARTVEYNFSANAAQAAGTYSGTVLYTATTL